MKSLLKLQGLAEDVPAQFAQILADLEGGKLRMDVRSEDAARIADRVRSAGLLVFTGLLASSLLLGGLLVLALGARPTAGLVAVSVGLALALLALVLHLAPPRLSKISVRRFIPRGSPARPGSPATTAPPPPPRPPTAPPA
jgi:ubiquinone biosynthesis protein